MGSLWRINSCCKIIGFNKVIESNELMIKMLIDEIDVEFELLDKIKLNHLLKFKSGTRIEYELCDG
jgi:hypothetical protein